MTNLYEKITHGDRRTIVRKYKKGTSLRVPGPATIVLKEDLALKITQEYDARQETWLDVTFHLGEMVETPLAPVQGEQADPDSTPSWLARVFGRIFQ